MELPGKPYIAESAKLTETRLDNNTPAYYAFINSEAIQLKPEEVNLAKNRLTALVNAVGIEAVQGKSSQEVRDLYAQSFPDDELSDAPILDL
jgi:hypothetical protein